MSEYTERIFAKMDKLIKDKPIEVTKQVKKYCKTFDKCDCGFCINYIGTRKKYFQNCANKCKLENRIKTFNIKIGNKAIAGYEIKY
jgi:hypothetical protein